MEWDEKSGWILESKEENWEKEEDSGNAFQRSMYEYKRFKRTVKLL